MFTYETTSPLRAALTLILGAQVQGVEIPFPALEGAYSERDMGDYPPVVTNGIPMDLSEWCGWVLSSGPNPCSFATGNGVVEAAELIVERAVENANIPPGPTPSERFRKLYT